MRLTVMSVMMLAILGCGEAPVAPSETQSPERLYARLRLAEKAVILSVHAPYDTVQLRAVPQNMYGDSIPHDARVRYIRASLLDTSLTVDSTGLVKVRTVSASSRVIAALTIDGTTRFDTVTIVVRNDSPVRRPARMEFFPQAPDSSWRWAGNTAVIGYDQLWARLYDANGVQIPRAQTVFSYSWNDDGIVRSVSPDAATIAGETYIRARVYAYGIVWTDSVLFRRIEPTVQFIVVARDFPVGGEARHRFYPDSMDVKPGTTIIFMNANGNQGFINPLFAASTCNSSFCGNRLMNTRTFTGSRLEWIDSTDIVFDQPAQVSAGRNYGALGLAGFPGTAWAADGASGDIAAYGLMRCVRVTSPHDGCGGRMSPAATGNTTLDVGYRMRMFNTPGVYRFHSNRFPGAQGVIIVKN